MKTKINLNCRNHVKLNNGSILCGIYQIDEDGNKNIFLCDDCAGLNNKAN